MKAPKKHISRPPTRLERFNTVAYRFLAYAFVWITLAVIAYIVLNISWNASPAMQKYGIGFITGTEWSTGKELFGILPDIWGTLYTSVLALCVSTIFGVAVALFLSERLLSSFVFNVLKIFGLQFHPTLGHLPDQIEALLKNLVELLAAIPSVVYGLWGIFVLIPLIRPLCIWVYDTFGEVPVVSLFIQEPFKGKCVLPAVIVLSIMLLPTISAISRDVLVAVPMKLREAAYGMGATRWETILSVVLPTSLSGIAGAVVLAFGRALGETMALVMLVGNNNAISMSLFSKSRTLASLLASNFAEADSETLVPQLMYAALVLLMITLLVNIVGELILMRTKVKHL